MARISSTVGLVSGINSSDIITQLMSLEEMPKIKLQARMATETAKKTAFTTIQAQVTTLRLFGTSIKKPQTFRNADVKSADENVVTGKAAPGAAAGSYKISVARLVSAQQSVGKGYPDTDTTRVGAGTLTLEMGGGALDEPTELDDLNGGKGIGRGKFRLTDRSGASTVVDVSDAMTLDDVVNKINTSLDVSVRASIKDSALVLTDQTGMTTSALRVDDIGTGTAAADLGIMGATNAAVKTGATLSGLRSTTPLADLYDGRGVRVAGGTAKDIEITTADGTTHAIGLASAKTLGDVVSAIKEQTGGKVNVLMSGGSLSLQDQSADYSDPDVPVAAPMTITAIGDSKALQDLGLAGRPTSATGRASGSAFATGVNTTMVSSLRGGKGLDLGTIRIRDRNGTTDDVDLSGAATVDEILQRINDSSANVKAEVKSGGNSITITDLNDRGGTLNVSDVSGTAAAQMGLAGNFTSTSAGGAVSGANLQKAWFSGNTLLRDLSGGKGIPDGKFSITDSSGRSQTITIDGTKDTTVGDVIAKINAATAFGVKASINENGDGLLLTDTAGGGTKMKVSEVNNGSTAKSLNILGSAATTTIDGSWEKTVAITATDKLNDVQKKISDLNWGLSATILNDGSDEAPHRLSLTSVNSGKAGRVVFDSGAVNLGERTLVAAQDAALFVGGDAGGQPMLVRASSNEVTGAIRGVTLSLTGVSDGPVTVNVARNVDNVVEAANTFVEGFNTLVTALKEYTKYDAETETRGTLLGDPAALSVETELYGMLNTVGNSSGKYRIAADVGLSIGSGGELQFDEDRFRSAFAEDPDAVTTLFTRAGAALDEEYKLEDLRQGRGVRRVTGTDFRVTAKDGSSFDVDITDDVTTVGDLLQAINSATGNTGKVTASLNTAGTGIDLVDSSTTGTQRLTVASLNGSVAASDLGLLVTPRNSRVSGKALVDVNTGNLGGIGSVLEKRLSRLIDPVNGIITRASKAVDSRNDAFQDRIDSIQKLLESKRARLEKQFSGLESSLSNLQGQQTALNSLSTMNTQAG